ncbi:zinc ribbon domain-containing protein [Spongisporangium articulatum]|uniref:Zinc ribbon domain-containing protein n=1 Tax=Spongisporangium articulatum TaxID=3362603 RepID=A0ABW8AUF0_9ACTN
MPRYDHRCRQCGDTFEVTRSITRLDEPAPCPAGHEDTVRLLTTVGVLGGTTSAGSSAPVASGGGCCGGGCCG